MRQLMIEDSKKFPGVTDGKTVLSNLLPGKSEGVRNDNVGLGGTRIDLDLLCGPDNSRCVKQKDATGEDITINGKTQLALAQGLVQFDSDAAGMSLVEFLETNKGKALGGDTGGIQGWQGTLFGVPYAAGSWQDKLIESFGGSHDFIGGKLSGLYDEQGKATRGRSELERKIQDTWSATGALVVSTPFAAAELLPPEMWQAISILLGAVK